MIGTCPLSAVWDSPKIAVIAGVQLSIHSRPTAAVEWNKQPPRARCCTRLRSGYRHVVTPTACQGWKVSRKKGRTCVWGSSKHPISAYIQLHRASVRPMRRAYRVSPPISLATWGPHDLSAGSSTKKTRPARISPCLLPCCCELF